MDTNGKPSKRGFQNGLQSARVSKSCLGFGGERCWRPGKNSRVRGWPNPRLASQASPENGYPEWAYQLIKNQPIEKLDPFLGSKSLGNQWIFRSLVIHEFTWAVLSFVRETSCAMNHGRFAVIMMIPFIFPNESSWLGYIFFVWKLKVKKEPQAILFFFVYGVIRLLMDKKLCLQAWAALAGQTLSFWKCVWKGWA